jgi:hypothetical protein
MAQSGDKSLQPALAYPREAETGAAIYFEVLECTAPVIVGAGIPENMQTGDPGLWYIHSKPRFSSEIIVALVARYQPQIQRRSLQLHPLIEMYCRRYHLVLSTPWARKTR